LPPPARPSGRLAYHGHVVIARCRGDIVAVRLCPHPRIRPFSFARGCGPGATGLGAVVPRTRDRRRRSATKRPRSSAAGQESAQRGSTRTTPRRSGRQSTRYTYRGTGPGGLMTRWWTKLDQQRGQSRSKISYTRTSVEKPWNIARTRAGGRPGYLIPHGKWSARRKFMVEVLRSCRSPGPPGRAGATASMKTPRPRPPADRQMPTTAARAMPPPIPRTAVQDREHRTSDGDVLRRGQGSK